MKKIIATLLVSLSCFGETFENLEYQLPKAAESWTVTKSGDETAAIKMVMYMQASPMQMLFITSTPGSKETNTDPETIVAEIRKQQPSFYPEVTLIERDDSSVLYKICVKNEEGATIITGWNRSLFSEKGNVSLAFQALTEKDLDPIWLDFLKEVTLK